MPTRTYSVYVEESTVKRESWITIITCSFNCQSKSRLKPEAEAQYTFHFAVLMSHLFIIIFLSALMIKYSVSLNGF